MTDLLPQCGRIDVSRTMARNMRYDGVPFAPDFGDVMGGLVNEGFVAGLFNLTPGYTVLGATVNPQGQHSNVNFGFGRWLSVETERNVQATLADLRDLDVVDAIGGLIRVVA